MIWLLVLWALISLSLLVAFKLREPPPCHWIAGADASEPEAVVIWLCVTHRCIGVAPTKWCAVAERKP